ncbi:hypothetical protein GCM10025864_35260 [Luteimicrobium album]|uniref:Uncharacterized protein n=1 Tax=Luteimicrobium album TaxID=1054550 RepID=A0ABQ6I551_9MICO|nr:hypothetical protein GCM10025864_35260 [Luteimicrobium album]
MVVDVDGDEPGGGERENRDVAADLLAVERGLGVHEVGDEVLVGDGDVDDVVHELRVVAGPDELGGEVGAG